MDNLRVPNRRMVKAMPFKLTGGIMTFIREPSSKRASIIALEVTHIFPQPSQYAFDDASQMVFVVKLNAGLINLTMAFIIHRFCPIHHDFGNGVILHKRLYGAIASNFGCEVTGQ